MFGIITAMIVRNAIFRTNLFWIEGFDRWTCSFGKPEKKICWTSQQGTEQSIFRVIFWTRFNIITPIILQNTIFRTILFRIEGFDSWTCSYGKPKKKIFSTSQQGTEQSIFRFIFWIRFEIITTMILQIPPSAPTFSNWNFW